MDSIEMDALDELNANVARQIQRTAAKSWADRVAVATDLLEATNRSWWSIHSRDSQAYERDLERLNHMTGWTGPHRLIARWQKKDGAPVLMPPKFFGGNPRALHEDFVASMSLNHAVLATTSDAFSKELNDQQSQEGAFRAHLNYFLREYAYAKFFLPRAVVLHSYATKLGIRDIPAPSNWPEVNHRLAFYIEAFPTHSTKFAQPVHELTSHDLISNVFVCALNSIVHNVILHLLRPKRVLLAGKSTWQAWPAVGLHGVGTDVSASVRRVGKTCPIYFLRAPSAESSSPTTIVRCNFLRTVYGPNSSNELERLGTRVLAM